MRITAVRVFEVEGEERVELALYGIARGGRSPPASAMVCAPTCVPSVVERTATARYHLDGLVKTETDFNGQQRTLGYDSARRLKGIDYAGATHDVAYAWDKLGRRTSLSQGGLVQAQYTYDEWGRLLTETRGSSVIRHWYDRRDPIRTDYPDGKVLTATYDAGGQLTSQGAWFVSGAGASTTTYGYDGDGHRMRKTTGGVHTTYV